MEGCIPKKALGLRQSEKDFWAHKGYQPELHEMGRVWQFQERCTSADGRSRTDSADLKRGRSPIVQIIDDELRGPVT